MSFAARHRAALGLTALVLASAVVRFAASGAFAVPWIAPDEMVYAEIGRSLWERGDLSFRGLATPYYSLLHPALVGAPMLLDDLGDAIRLAQALQALAMSLVAVPAYLWARRLLDPRWALTAAALTVLPAALVYSGFLMSEALFYPAVTLALAAIARMLERPTAFNQGTMLLAVTAASAVRMQALVLLPTLVLASLLHALFERRGDVLRRLAPLVLGVAGAGLGLLALRFATAGRVVWDDLLGAYGTVGRDVASPGEVVHEILSHLGVVVTASLVLPALATAVLAVRAFRGREHDGPTRAFVAVTVAYVTLLVGEVGAFAAQALDALSERYVATALPPLLIGLVVWSARGAPRPHVTALAVAAAGVLSVAAIPADHFGSALSLHDVPSGSLLLRLTDAGHTTYARVAVLAVAGLATALFLALPRRRAPLAVAVVAAGLGALSLAATIEAAHRSADAQRFAVGDGDPRWLDAAGGRDVTLLATGDRPWPAVARTLFWNRSVADALRLQGVENPLPPGTPEVEIAPDGFVVDRAGRRVTRAEVVAPATLQLEGERLLDIPAGTGSTYGLTLWRIDGPMRVGLRLAEGFQPNGDFSDAARVLVPGCVRGVLHITLLGKGASPVAAYVDGFELQRFEVPSGTAVTKDLPAPPYADGTHTCTYDLRTEGLVGSTTVVFLARHG